MCTICYLCATHTSQIMFLTSECLLPNFIESSLYSQCLQRLLYRTERNKRHLQKNYAQRFHCTVSQYKCLVVRIYSKRNCEHTRKIKLYNHHFTSPTNLSIHSKAFKGKKIYISTRF